MIHFKQNLAFEDPNYHFYIQKYVHDTHDIPPHTHNFTELNIVFKGKGEHIVDNYSHPISAGDIFVINNVKPHAFKNCKHMIRYIIRYLPEFFADNYEIGQIAGYHALFILGANNHLTQHLHLNTEQLDYLENIFLKTFVREYKNRIIGFDTIIKSTLSHLIIYLSRAYSKQKISGNDSILRIAESISYLEEFYNKKIKLQNLAKMTHLSTNQYLRIFKKAYGKSPMKYLNTLRIQRALQMLRFSKNSITKIALQSGFANSAFFSKQFKKTTGLSPNAYRLNIGDV